MVVQCVQNRVHLFIRELKLMLYIDHCWSFGWHMEGATWDATKLSTVAAAMTRVLG
jgi:hypothetical protein